MSLAVALAVALECTPLQGQGTGEVDTTRSVLRGTVRGRFGESVRPLAHAVIEAASGAGRLGAVADSAGQYALEGLAPGSVRLRVAHPGYESITLTVMLPPNGVVEVDLELTADPLELPGVNVPTIATARPREAAPDSAPVPNPSLEVELLDLSPGVSQPGLVDVVQALPGNDPTDPTDVLFMRGSTTDLKLVLLDGVPVYTPFHVAGLLTSFDPTVLQSADLHVGGAPARYDGGLTHILDLRTRSARRDRARVSGSLDLLSTSIAAEVPVGSRAGVMASGRVLHQLGAGPLGGERPYGYRDLLVSVDADATAEHRFRATGFWNSESVRLGLDPRSGDATWSNRAVSVGYAGSIGSANVNVTAGASGYEAALPLQPSGEAGGPIPSALLASAQDDRVRVVTEATWGPARAPLKAGASYEGLTASFAARSLDGNARSASRGASDVLGVFIEATRPISSGLTVRTGLRGDLFAGNALRLSPRAALLWEVGPDALLTVAAGRYHQITRSPEVQVEETLADFANLGVGPGGLLPVATADHVVLSLNQRLAGVVNLDIQGFWKRYEGLHGTGEESIRSSGVDLRVLSVRDRGTVWLGYGLSWFWSPLDLSGQTSEFVGRHLLSAGTSGRLSGPIHGEAKIAYGAGLPSTSIPFRSEDLAPAVQGPTTLASAEPTPLVDGLALEFLRIDLELYALLEPEWGGRPVRVRPYVRLLNALDRRDSLFYTFQPWRSQSVTPLAERPILPVFGIAFSF